MDAEYARLFEEDLRKVEEAHSRAMEQGEKQHKAERGFMERENRKGECIEEKRREREAAHSNPVTRLSIYKQTWAVLRSNWKISASMISRGIRLRILGEITEERVCVPSATGAYPVYRGDTNQIYPLGNAMLAPGHIRWECS